METKKDDNTAATAGRGFLVITAAKLWFMVGGALIAFSLPKILGVEGYGQYTDLNNTMSILSMVMVTGVLQSVAKFVSERPDHAGGVAKQALKVMLVLGLIVGGGFIICAPWIAEMRHNPELTSAYRAAGVVLFAYALYSVFIGVLNGRKQFLKQAMFDMAFTTLKACLVVGLAVVGLGIMGAFTGFALAAVGIMLAAAWKVWPSLGDGEPQRRLYAFGAQVMLYTLIFNLIFKLDVLMLKPAAIALLGTAENADSLLGAYGLALQFSRLPWQATLAITFVIFPLVSEATFAQDREKTRLYIRQTLRYSLLIIGIPAAVLTAVPTAFIGLYGAEYQQGVVALIWLAPAYFVFAIFNVVNTILMSSGKATAALIVGALTVGSAALMYHFLLGTASTNVELMARTGQLTALAFAIGLIAGLAILWRSYGAPLPMPTLLRTLFIAAAVVVLGRFLLPVGQIDAKTADQAGDHHAAITQVEGTPAAAATPELKAQTEKALPGQPQGSSKMAKIKALAIACGLGVLYLVLLVVTREFGAEDKERFLRVIKRKPKTQEG